MNENLRPKEKRQRIAFKISFVILIGLLGIGKGVDMVADEDLPTILDLLKRNTLVVDPPISPNPPEILKDRLERVAPEQSKSSSYVLATSTITESPIPLSTPTSTTTVTPIPPLENGELPYGKSTIEPGSDPVTIEVAPNQIIDIGERSSLQTNDQGIPIEATIYGKTHELDPNLVADLKQKAIETGIPQVIHADIYTVPRVYPPSTEHPTYTQLPPEFTDNSEVLAEHGVNIIQGKYSQLAISDAAFQPGSPLEHYSKNGRKLTIVIVDGQYVFTGFMNDPKYDSVRDLLKGTNCDVSLTDSELTHYYQVKTARIRDNLKSAAGNINQLLGKENLTREELIRLSELQLSYRKLQAQLYRLDQGLVSAYEMLASFDFGSPTGRYVADDHPTGNPTIFLAIGSNVDGSTYHGLLYYDGNGNINFEKGHLDDLSYKSPVSPRFSHPDPRYILRDTHASPDNLGSYPFGGDFIGQMLHHELSHDELRNQGWFPTRYDEQGFPVDWEQRQADSQPSSPMPNLSEYDADMRAYQQLQNAWDIWQNSRFNDHSSYYFAFSVPKQSDSDPTEYILTDNQINSSEPFAKVAHSLMRQQEQVDRKAAISSARARSFRVS